jgi:hypothetical protein
MSSHKLKFYTTKKNYFNWFINIWNVKVTRRRLQCCNRRPNCRICLRVCLQLHRIQSIHWYRLYSIDIILIFQPRHILNVTDQQPFTRNNHRSSLQLSGGTHSMLGGITSYLNGQMIARQQHDSLSPNRRSIMPASTSANGMILIRY